MKMFGVKSAAKQQQQMRTRRSQRTARQHTHILENEEVLLIECAMQLYWKDKPMKIE